MGDELISKPEAQALIDLEEEFERELKRNALAIQLLRERAEEAKIAKSRAELSAQKKECMMNKLRTLQDNMAATTETLTKTQERIDKQEQVRAMVNSMKDKVNKYEVKLKMQAQNSQQLGMLGNVMPDFDFPEPLINYDEEEETEAQKDPEIESQVEPVGAQIEPVGAQIEPVEAQKQTSTDEAQKVEEEEEPQQIQQTSFINFGDLSVISDNSFNNSEKTQKKNLVKSKEDTKKETKGIDYAQTVLNLQEKLSRKSHSSVVQTTQDEVKSQEDANDSKESFSGISNTSTTSASTSWHCNADSADHESDPHCDLNESVQRLESKYAEARSEESMDIDLNDSVQRLEAKCAGVREELGRMALSEQYMRTKQAQLRARKKELEAKEATIKAELREKEAYDMREKVHGMMKLLAERRNKLKVTENVIVKKGNVVDNVNKILNQKEIRIKQKEKQKDELLAFGKKPPK